MRVKTSNTTWGLKIIIEFVEYELSIGIFIKYNLREQC